MFKNLDLDPNELNSFAFYVRKYGMRAGLGSGNLPENIFCTSDTYRWEQFVVRLKNDMFAICEYDSRQMAFRVLTVLANLDSALNELINGTAVYNSGPWINI